MNVKIHELEVNCGIGGYHEDNEQVVVDAEQFVKKKLLPVIEDIMTEMESEFNSLVINQAEVSISLDQLFGRGIFPDQVPIAPIRALLRNEILKKQASGTQGPVATPDAWTTLLFILSKGYRPWNFYYSTHEDFEQDLLSNFINRQEVKTELKKLLELSKGRQKLAANFSIAFVIELLAKLYDSEYNSPEEFISDMKLIVSSGRFKDEFSKKYLLLVVVCNSDHSSSAALKIRDATFTNKSESDAVIAQINTGFLRKSLKLLFVEQNADYNLEEDKAGNKDAAEGINAKEKLTSNILFNKDVSGADEIYVSNSGIALLAPYLTSFFEKTGYWKNGKLENPSQCVYLLHLLCGISDIKDYQLALNKVICGLQPSENIEPFEGFANEEVSEARELLNAVISYWSVLKQTSPEALQVTFLQRNGKLQITSDFALLEVERRTEDILLDYIPWTFGLLMLPWMKHPLKVSW